MATCIFLVLTGSTQQEVVGDYVYQPTLILDSAGDLVKEVKTGKVSDRLTSPVFSHAGFHGGNRHTPSNGYSRLLQTATPACDDKIVFSG